MNIVRRQAQSSWGSAVGLPCSKIQRRMSSARHAVTRADSFTGSGNDLDWIRRHKVDFEMGTSTNTCGCRRKPVSGSTGDKMESVTAVAAEIEVGFGMIWPYHGIRHRKT